MAAAFLSVPQFLIDFYLSVLSTQLGGLLVVGLVVLCIGFTFKRLFRV